LGIDVYGNAVTVNFDHERLVDTGLSNKPTVNQLDDTSVYSIFRRKKHKRRPHIAAGDGNPFIYALKSMHDITIAKNEIVRLIPNFNTIIQATTELANPEVIIPMPSAHIIADVVAKRVQKESLTSSLVNGLFRKATFGEAIANVDLNAIDSKHINKLNVELGTLKKFKDMEEPFSLKHIKNHYRPAFNPLIINELPEFFGSVNRITLVDDLLATGTTLRGAIKLLRAELPNVEINSICLLSALKRVV